ncbi:MAG: cupin domain-containing protein [Acidimicrobiales bacterium]|nr:cupin domain-containing protein [Acidimicrobiales bacterium]MYD82845.1 cupin domain-containing protein [Acidimicrobiales bacterium]MYJ64825.1 cupin domain-containing protein [Acidimicrobiales bacterium]
MTEDEFRSELVARGYGEPRSYEFEPDADGELHSHEFSAMAMVTEGEFRLGLTDETRVMGVGDWCEVSAGTLHSEMAGPVGATLLVGTK